MQLLQLLGRIKPAPEEWFDENALPPEPTVQPLECTSYAELVECWKDEPEKGKKGALFWTDSIDVSFSFMLAIIASTPLKGAQIWGRVIGPAGSAKSSLCAALTACKQYVYKMGMQTGLHSGQGGKDIFQEINGMTVVLEEGDMLVNAPNRDATLAQIRDSWGGHVNAHYRSGVKYSYSGMRTTYIIAGTNTLRKLNRSAAGDRFLDVIIHEKRDKSITDPHEHKMLNRVAEMELDCYKIDDDYKDELSTQDSVEKENAVRKTVGFIKHLREVTPQRIAALAKNVPATLHKDCTALAQIVACMRARPDDKTEVEETEAELATRLTRQFVRLSMCTAVVMDRPIDREVMRRSAIACANTSRGPTLSICHKLMVQPLDATGLSVRTGYGIEKTRHYLSILIAIGAVKADTSKAASGAIGRGKSVYRLSPQMSGLLFKLKSMLENT